MAEDLKYKQLYKDIKKRIQEIEEENDTLNVKLFKARKSIRHLKLERTFLLDRMEKAGNPPLDYASDNSDIASDIYSHDESETFIHKIQGHKHGRIEKMIANKPQRKKKDPNAPKGPGNVFFLFCRLERDKIKDENPTENLGEVTRLLGQKWKSLTKEEKKKYYDLYKRELEEYEEAMKSYNGGTATTAVAHEEGVVSSTVSSPAQSTEISLDEQNLPEFMDEDQPIYTTATTTTDTATTAAIPDNNWQT